LRRCCRWTAEASSTEAPDGGYRLTPYDPAFERQMALAEMIMHDDREVLRALAK